MKGQKRRKARKQKAAKAKGSTDTFLSDHADSVRRAAERADAELPSSFESPESSNIHGAAWDADTEMLTIVFKGHRGQPERTYRYPLITLSVWKAFVQAESKGKFFAERIRPFSEGHRAS